MTSRSRIDKEEVRILPRSLETERLVLGTLMGQRGTYAQVAELLTESSFYDELHQKVFNVIHTIEQRGDSPDIVTVYNELSKKETVSISEIAGIAQNFTLDLYQHALILHEKERRRRFFELGNYLISNSFSEQEDIYDVIQNVSGQIEEFFSVHDNPVSTMRDAISQVYQIMDRNRMSETAITGCATGFNDFDKKSGGLQKSDLIVIAGETSQGKTSFATSIVKNIALSGGKVAFYSLEMNKEQLAARMMAMQSGIPANKILFSKMQPFQFKQLDKTIHTLNGAGIYFDDRSTSNIDTIINSIRSLVLKYGINGAVVDYLQILNVNMKGYNKEQQMGEVARRLKNLAKELGIWIITLSQLNRDNTNPVPNLNRLRDSGQIAEAADIVMFVYRAEVYNRTYPEPFADKPTQGTAMIDVAKGRNIGLMKFMCGFDKRTTHFTDYSTVDESKLLNEQNENKDDFEMPF